MGDLNVELYGTHVGTLAGQHRERFDFVADPAGIETFGLGSSALSYSVPLTPSQVTARAGRRRTFFSELLPEGDALDELALRQRVPANDTIALLRAYGRDVAGAIQIFDPDAPDEPRTPALRPATDRSIGDALLNIQDAPIGNVTDDGKSSLPGVHNKLVLARHNGHWNWAEGGFPSTHIVKPEMERPNKPNSRHLIYDEEYGDRLAKQLGLLHFDVAIEEFTQIPGLVIERYDRSSLSPDGRVHQEDLGQALGVSRANKYQENGGFIDLKRIADFLRVNIGRESVVALARMLIAAVGIGNTDLHAKNISILHPYDGAARLAPAYDFVPLIHHGYDGRMAMAVNGKYPQSDLTAADLTAELSSWRLPKAADLVNDTLIELEQAISSLEPHASAYPTLQEDLLRFAVNLRSGSAAGAHQRTNNQNVEHITQARTPAGTRSGGELKGRLQSGSDVEI